MNGKELQLLLLLARSASDIVVNYYHLKNFLSKENEEKLGLRSIYGKETL